MLSGKTFVHEFLTENQQRTKHLYTVLTERLTAAGIPYVTATSAMFVWVDMRDGLTSPSWQGEADLWQCMVDLGLLLTPGEHCWLPVHLAENQLCYTVSAMQQGC